MCNNAKLNAAGKSKMDDFYTLYEDVAAEMRFYRDSFSDKTVLCNCDEPLESNFVLYFLCNFKSLGLKRLIVTSYAGSAIGEILCNGGAPLPIQYVPGGAHYASVIDVPDDFEIKRDYAALFSMPGNIMSPLEGDGDFRSPECSSLIDEADILTTNPPFSLFRDYLRLTISKDKKFLIIGNINALTCKEVFPLFQKHKLWLGRSIRSGDRKFYVPDTYPLDAAGCGFDANGRRYIRVKGVRWFTNMESDKGFDRLSLVNTYNAQDYPMFENYNAINVNRTKSIPRDFSGIMGVPISFLDHYCPEQFDIIMLANGNARTSTDSAVLDKVGYKQHPADKGGVGIINGRRMYARVLVRNRNPEAVIA